MPGATIALAVCSKTILLSLLDGVRALTDDSVTLLADELVGPFLLGADAALDCPRWLKHDVRVHRFMRLVYRLQNF